MVDFQERDTRRSLGDDGDDDSGADEAKTDADETETDADDAETDADDAGDGATDEAGARGDGTNDAETGGAGDAETNGENEAVAGTNGTAAHGEPPERAPVGTSEDAHGTPEDGQGHGDRDHEAHDHHATDRESISAAVLTVSTSRSMEEDGSGDAIVEVLEGEGHEVATRELVNDDYDGVQSAVDALVNRGDVEALVVTGGTGVSPSDVTPGAVRPLFEKELPGFGEVFRALSFEEIGTRVVATRATAGIADGVPVFCLPGSEDAARLGTAEVIVPEVGHLVGLARPHEFEE